VKETTLKSILWGIALAALGAFAAVAQDSSTGSGSYGQSSSHQSSSSAEAEVGQRAPGDAASSNSKEGRARAGIEVGTASATQGGRTDSGTPVRESTSERKLQKAEEPQLPTESPHRAADQAATEDKDLNRIPHKGATMMSKKEQAQGRASARKRSAARKDRSKVRSHEIDVPNPSAKPSSGNRQE
jgi:hypothetical protein